MKGLKKYFAFCKLSLQNTIVYRGPVLVWVAANFFSVVAVASLWISSSSSGQTMGGYLKAELVTYYIAALFLQWLVYWFPFYEIIEEIKGGEIVMSTLMKPFSFFWKKFAEEVGYHLVGPIFGIGGSLVLAFIFRQYLVLNLSLEKLLILIPAILIAIFLTFSFSLCQGLLAFWFVEVSAVDGLIWGAKTLLGGQGIPISFIPAAFQMVIKGLPFRYMFSFPLEIFLDKLSSLEIIQGMIMGVLWIFAFVLLYKLMWQKGRKAYTAFGQ